MAAFVKAENLKHRFSIRDDEGGTIAEIPALDGIDLTVEAGQFIAVLGPNGSGKSTFARHLNALLMPTEGTLFVDGKNTRDEDLVWEIRRAAGMIFQNPDNQIVAGIVEEDVAFGPENLGIPPEEIADRVEESLGGVDMAEYRCHSPENLSGGQKQRVAVAGVLAMRPGCIVMDEPTAMLDPAGRKEVMETVRRLNRENGVTVILITHFMEEAVQADAVFVLNEGKVAMSGTPREIFSAGDRLRECGLEMPKMARLADALRKDGLPLPEGILTRDELAESLDAAMRTAAGDRIPEDAAMRAAAEGCIPGDAAMRAAEEAHIPGDAGEIGGSARSGDRACVVKKEKLRLENVSYAYTSGTSYAAQALRNVDLTLYESEVVGLIGHTGSGKSTLIQMLNGLLKPDEGRVYYEGRDIHERSRDSEDGFSLRQLRGCVGLVFQFAENQLFETSVVRDVAFGPKNLGVSEEEAEERAKDVLRMVNLDESCWERSPFELSGGQRRRAAIAGVIAMGPSVLILDEPTAGLDPGGKDELFELIRSLHAELALTVILVSHDMDEVADLAGRIVVLREGEILMDGTPAEVFSRGSELEEASLSVPEVTGLMGDLRMRGYPVDISATTPEEALREIERLC